MLKNNTNILLSSNPHKKEEILFSSKTNKEVLLSLIKSGQLSLLSQINQKSSYSGKEKVNIIKTFLKDLKNNLTYILKEKKSNAIYLENNINNTKQIIQNKIFNKNKDNNYNNTTDDTNENEKYLETEAKEKNYEGNELSKLKFQNFKIENEIQKTNFLIVNINLLVSAIKAGTLFPEDYIKFSLINYKQNPEEIDNFFNSKIKQEKDLLNKYIDLQEQQKNYLEQYQIEINTIKKKIISKNLIDSRDIIYEDILESDTSYITNNKYSDYNNYNKDINIGKNENDINIFGKYNNNKNTNNILNLNMNIIFNINLKDL